MNKTIRGFQLVESRPSYELHVVQVMLNNIADNNTHVEAIQAPPPPPHQKKTTTIKTKNKNKTTKNDQGKPVNRNLLINQYPGANKI